VDAYTITFRPEDQKLEAMPDDAVYARKVARLALRHQPARDRDLARHRGHAAADGGLLDEPIGDPAAINTVLMCEAARERGVKVLLSGMGADELFGGYRKHLACLMASRYRRLPRAVRRPGPARGEQPAGLHRRPRPALPTVGQAVHDVRRAARGSAVPPQLHAVRPGGPDRARRPGASRLRHRRDRRACRRPTTTTPWTTRSTGCAWPTRACSWPASTSPTRTARAWPPRWRCASRSWTRWSRRRRLRSPAGTRSAARSRRPRLRTRRKAGCRTRSCTGRRRPSARRCGPGSGTTCGS
jgi:asparagine synthetase B (glutamine-hydrolysing)